MTIKTICANQRGMSVAAVVAAIVMLSGLVAGSVLAFFLFERGKPVVTVGDPISFISREKAIPLKVEDGRSGIRSIKAEVIQGDTIYPLFEKKMPTEGGILKPGPAMLDETIVLRPADLKVAEGPAQLIITAVDFSWWRWQRGNETVLVFPVTIDTKPPIVRVTDAPRFIKNGSAGFVVYTINEPPASHGVIINGHFHPGFTLSERGENFYCASIGIPYDAEKIAESYATVTDQAGNMVKAPFGMILKPVVNKHDKINISDDFLTIKLPEFAAHYPDLQGMPIEQFLYINGELRKANYERVVEICKLSTPQRLWDGPFSRMARSGRQAGFAEIRTYYYQGEEVDQQTHLGVDLASVRHADIEAANRGVVVFADYLGIYGDTVIIDHGLGVFTLYSHMSSISVAVGDEVAKNAKLGQSGTTGMAGGDHLHFSVLVNGIFVNPIEWWDGQWLRHNYTDFFVKQ